MGSTKIKLLRVESSHNSTSYLKVESGFYSTTNLLTPWCLVFFWIVKSPALKEDYCKPESKNYNKLLPLTLKYSQLFKVKIRDPT
jgi:hypothetical protein